MSNVLTKNWKENGKAVKGLKYMIIYFRNVLMLEMAPHLCICIDPFCFPSTHLDDVMSIEGLLYWVFQSISWRDQSGM